MGRWQDRPELLRDSSFGPGLDVSGLTLESFSLYNGTMDKAAESAESGTGLLKRCVDWFSRAWRLLATAFSFVVFGFLASMLGLVVIPLVKISGAGTEKQEFRIQSMIRNVARFYLFMIQALGIFTIRCEGKEKLREPGLLVVANHPTLLDALVLISHMPQVDCVVKERYFHDPFLGAAAQGAGYIPSGDGPTVVDACVDRLEKGRSIIIFPEGTRSPVRSLGSFNRGTAHISIRSQRHPIPVVIHCEPPGLYRGQKWWHVSEKRLELTLRVGEPLLPPGSAEENVSRSRAARALTDSMHLYFKRELAVV